MSIDLKMPALSPTMEKGTLAKWLVSVGDLVKAGDLIAEIETDKATMEFEAVDEGFISALVVAEGTDDIPVGMVIATLGEASSRMPLSSNAPEEQPALSLISKETPAEVVLVAHPATPEPLIAPHARFAEKVKVSPLAARIAAMRRIDLDPIVGTGPGGRIVKADLGLKPKVVLAASALSPEAPAAAAPAGVPYEAVRLSGMRKTIARRLTLAKQTVPHFYLSIDCRIDALLKLRSELNAMLIADGVKLSVNDLLIKALARALEDVPEANVQFAGDELYRFGRVDVSMAVALDNGLVTPVIADAGGKRLSVIAREAQMLASQARDGKLLPEQYQGGTVSISNLGMFGIERIFPVINPPQAMILGIGVGEERIRAVDGQAQVATMLTATASFDHRAIDGAIGARAMAALRASIEEPVRLIA